MKGGEQMNQSNREREWYSQQFADFEKSLNGQSEQPLHQVRKKAIAWFEENGFPTIKQEEWRFTNVSPISKTQFSATTPTASSAVNIEAVQPFFIDNEFIRLVFVNGAFTPELSNVGDLAKGVTVSTLQEAMENEQDVIKTNLAKHANIDENGFVALNTAFLNEGAYVHVGKNIVLEQPIHFLNVATDASNQRVVHPRNLIVADENSQLQLIESYVSLTDGAYFTNPVTEVIAGDNAVVDHYKIQNESTAAFHTSLTQICQKRSSVYRSHNYTFGGAITRNDLNAVLDGEGIECTLNGLYLATGKQLIDNHSVIDHAQPHCNSHELYKGILDDQARAVFSGKIHVHPDAQKTDAIQSNQNLVLSEEATVDTKPQLEIYADDVRCTHGGTVGQMDKDGIFYLRARGIGEETARNIMIQAFAGEVAQSIKNEAVREHLESLVLARLKDGHLAIS
jgi:Fe-S cluster assembly protein SufD